MEALSVTPILKASVNEQVDCAARVASGKRFRLYTCINDFVNFDNMDSSRLETPRFGKPNGILAHIQTHMYIDTYKEWLRKFEEKEAGTNDDRTIRKYKEKIKVYSALVQLEQQRLDNLLSNQENQTR
ncbi:unnamed protein product [Rotaria magnacalcarata]|uniref:Uncharacterized protein n=1 Tax=Rotaria magnacalcarata TaxID=392030 RepID=A0A819Z5W3_9BILA|nr:unnamed protein product [Rotaria magnacalcarata]CAF4190449.1 unnamed protein product [Rotaria magnacalcarata]